jgi:hypothetical protein
MSEPEPFDRFITRTAAARPEDFHDARPAAAEPAEAGPAADVGEFERMRAYILNFYEGVRPVRSFIDAGGSPIDCVPFEQQPSVRAANAAGLHIAAPAPSPARKGRGARRPAPCPEGTVPMVRITLERLIPYGTLENYFSKTHQAAPPAPKSQT